MKYIQDLASSKKEKVLQFLSSFDYVFSDMDGVLLLAATPLPGADTCLNMLKALGKHIGFVTNNTIASFDVIKAELKPFHATDSQIVTPILSVLTYLKRIKCPKDIFCIGGNVLRDSLKSAGYNLVDIENGELEEDMTTLKNVCLDFLEKSKNVGAIVADLDLNFKSIQAEAAILLLTRNRAMPFLAAAIDESAPLSENIQLIGNEFYVSAIERIAKKQCTILAKPSIELGHYLAEQYKIKDPKRVLFIGDSLTSDIVFANKAGFQSLLVLTGQTKMGDLVNWTHEEENRPDYYISSLDHFSKLLTDLGIV